MMNPTTENQSTINPWTKSENAPYWSNMSPALMNPALYRPSLTTRPLMTKMEESVIESIVGFIGVLDKLFFYSAA